MQCPLQFVLSYNGMHAPHGAHGSEQGSAAMLAEADL
jgi:hypothetical protein